MSDDGWAAAWAYALGDEGAHSNDPADPGGDTWYGLSRTANPDMDPWPPTLAQAQARYWTMWWQPRRFGQLPAWLSAKVFDSSINMGSVSGGGLQGIVCLQRAIRACDKLVMEDGYVGAATAAAAAMVNQDCLMAALKSECAAHYRQVAVVNPVEGARFLVGWLNRAYSAPPKQSPPAAG
jgi:lysozyme family protein